MALLFLIVFVDLLGFGLIIPLFPFFGERLGASPTLITAGIAVYSLGQFVATPVWGRLSDAIGRKPIFMISMLGATLSYLWLGLAGSIGALIAARALGGVMAGNISAAYAYVADITTPQERARGMGILGAAFGLGFTLGPALGGMLAGADPNDVNVLRPSLVAAALALIAFLGSWLLLPESLPATQRKPLGEPREGGASPFGIVAGRVDLGLLIGGMFVVALATTMMQSIYPLWASDQFGHGPRAVGWVFFALGLGAVFCQTLLVAPLSRRFGEKAVALTGIVLLGLGLVGMSVADTPLAFVLALLPYGMGAGLTMPSMSALASLHAGERERGAVLGAFQSASSLGRIVGPLAAGALYQHGGLHSPFVVAALCSLPALWLVLRAEAIEGARRQPIVP
jgi:DHA1 family tetracycline resistance protein-like MFS transporter